MKRFLLFTLLLTSAMSMTAQSPSYVDFEWDIFRFGYAVSSAENQSGGLAFGGELRYNATDHFSLGFGGDGSVFGTDFDGDSDLGVSGSSLLIGDYYFNNRSSTRGFVGVGFGLYSTGTLTIRNDDIEEVIKGTTGFGIAPRVGMEFGHIRLLGQYNITMRDGHSNYFGLTVALTLWGGYRGNNTSATRNERM